jgi:hypothetical protein
LDSTSTLITLSTKEEEDFVSNFLYKENKIVDNIWLGAKKLNNNLFKWIDGSDMKYSNWEEKNPSNDLKIECVEMKSKFSYFASETSEGKWANVPCTKKNLIVCQKMQTWTLSYLRDSFIKLKKESEINIKRLEENDKSLKNSLDGLNKILIPIGFIYVQMPNQNSPQEIWSSMKWTDVSTQYANVFFRVIGDKTETFGKIQEEETQTIRHAFSQWENEIANERNQFRYDLDFPKVGWTDWFETGSKGNIRRYSRFKITGDEVHPRNMAIKIWKRSE